ncbi:MAG TPA: general secretion pathway protein GspE [Geobacter sp.]|nr:general secretion pathway protein GspE [Geobacter sp.]
MSARLGEMLLKAGALTEAQLEQVLNAQSIYGGRLGTNLVEMGFIEEDELARVLSEQLGVPCVESTALDSIPEALLGVIPRKTVERYRAIPLALEGKRLTIAMADPASFEAIEEIGFSTGLVIIPRVCSELRLSLALERLYGIRRPVRYIPVQGGVRSTFAAAAVELAETDHVAGNAARAGVGNAAPGPERVPVTDVAEMLALAAGEADVVQAVLSYLAGEFDRGGFLRLKSGAAKGVQAVADGMPVREFGSYAASIDDAPRLKRVVEEKRLYLGEMESEGPEGNLIRAMGGKAPGPALLVPVSLGGEVTAVICAHDRRGRLGGGVFELQRVAVMAELSFEILSLRKRIMTA